LLVTADAEIELLGTGFPFVRPFEPPRFDRGIGKGGEHALRRGIEFALDDESGMDR
jgi:hypothetical protein